LRETLRDRRTLITLFLMPLIVYPILSLLLQGFIASGFQQSQAVGGTTQQAGDDDEYYFLFESNEAFNTVSRFLKPGYRFLQRSSGDETIDPAPPQTGAEIDIGLVRHNYTVVDQSRGLTLRQMIIRGEADVGVILSAGKLPNGQPGRPEFTLVYIRDDLRSAEALRFMERILESFNLAATLNALNQLRSPEAPLDSPIRVAEETVSRADTPQAGISFAALIPLILTLMTITGAVYPAIDLTAGERERGTLESLIAAPIPRMRILVGKLVAIVAVAMLTAVVNLVGMSITLWVFQFDRALFGEQGLTLLTVVKILGLLMLFAVFFSSVLLVITSFARSFKEGQAYLIPLMMVALAPSLISLKPDLELSGLWTVTPLVNIVLLARDVLSGKANWPNVVVTVCSTILYSTFALTMAARFFGTARILYGQDQGIGALLRRPRESRDYASASLALLCLALLFPASFLWQGVMVRAAGDGATTGTVAAEVVRKQLGLAALGLALIFLVIPWLIATFHRVRFRKGFGLLPTPALAIVAGVLMGIGFGPLLLQGIAWSAQLLEQLGISDEAISRSLVQRGEDQIAKLKDAPVWLVLLAMAIVPAICEELFFRGLLFRALRATMSPWKTILATALMFGLFHLISASGLTISRLLPTTVMGVVLGWVCYRSGSVIPSILLHALHNTITVSFAWFRDELVEKNLIAADQSSVPLAALVAGLLCVGLGVALLLVQRLPRRESSSPARDVD
jgi:membrane protease YdiL (CAAX protease family)/ABC-type Na+ efflux pump permease subunit